ncbi:TipAS antibiotic-recognition domain-containing protein [Microbacterium sp. 179-B 1A2 NHS]|uniref:MerR family transcriptional regulator n=1 Tax=Microbacterium sp. 179-B 1A2 NHS TaxID=3142383 RepID=UPI0039A29231
MSNEWSIQHLAKVAGTTSRTLRHYDEIGLLPPARVGANGYRYYDAASLVRLQRVLLLRALGLGLPQIADVLSRGQSEQDALAAHLALLHDEQDRLGRQVAAVESTIQALQRGEVPVAEQMFDGFDHTVYEEEVTHRWGAGAYAESDAWWRGLDAQAKEHWQEQTKRLGADWADAAERGVPVDSDEAQDLAARHIEWLSGVPGTPAAQGGDVESYVLGLADMYVADARFAANYGGDVGARFVRDVLRQHYGFEPAV